MAHVSLSPADVPMATAMLALPQMSLVGTMMIPTVAANNAAAAANNVNANLNSVILQLSNTVGPVIYIYILYIYKILYIRQLCLSGRGEGLFWPCSACL